MILALLLAALPLVGNTDIPGGNAIVQSGVAMARSNVRLLSEEKPTVILGGTVEAVRAAIDARKRGEETLLFAPRPYLGEERAGVYDLELKHSDSPDDPLMAEMFNPSYGAEDAYQILRGRGWKAKDILVPFSNRTAVAAAELSRRTTPLLVKRALDRALLTAGVEYLTGAVAIGVDTNGVTIATRAGERRIAASRVIDARMEMPNAAGEYDVSWAIVTNRAAPCVGHVRRRVYLPDGSPSSRARAEREIRDAAFSADIIDMAPMGRYSQVGEVREGEGSSPFVTSADVVVVGGGTAGAPAAVAAARSGAKTVVVEWLNVLGGITTEGRIGGYYHGNRRGFTSEIDKAMKGVAKDYCLAKGEWYRRELGRLGAEVWFGALAYGVRMEGNRVAAVKVALADGTCAEIRCKVVVDASGNCDIAAAAGCDTEYLSAKELSLQGAGVAPQPLGLTGVNSDVGFVDETCPQDIFGFLLRTRLSVPDRTWNVSQMSDSRERRRLVGEMRITPLDILAGRRYHDTICVTKSNFDTHGQTDSDIFFVKSPGKRGDVHHAHVPYRCLLPKRVDGLLVAGLGVSAHRDAMPVLRMQPDVQNVGYAAGLAAAQAAMRSVQPRGIDVADLQRRLVEKGCIDAADIADSDSPPPDETVFKVEECSKLHERLKDASWDEGWNFKGMSQFGRSVSDVDSALIALGACRYSFAAPEVKRLADMLTATNEYSHFRAIARAAEGCGVDVHGRRRLAKSLHRLLSLPGVGGHSRERVEPLAGYDDSVADKERTMVLRELVLARALYNLGDEAGLARRTLRTYLRDYRRVYANHAKMVLAQKEVPDGSSGAIRRMLEDPGAFSVGKLPPRSPSWPSRRLEIGKDEWLFDIDDWRVDLSKGWRWLWRPKADFPAMLEGFERPSFDDSGWESIDLPASWEGLGKGTPIYVNAGWTFPKDSPPHVPLSSAPASTQPGWTVVSEPNPTARLRRSFDLPDDWCGREIRLWIGAAQAALAVWCNGTFVGFSQGATDAAEFDLTPHVRSKGNVLALQVFKYAAGTYLEDHDAWRVSGIYRETFLYSVPKSHIADVTLSSDIDAKRISATVAIANPLEGGTVEFSAGGVSESKSAARRVDAVLHSGSFPEWNPESPSLVPVRVLLRDGAGKILDIRHFRTALCRSEIENGVYRINGRPFKFQGVNRHEIDSLRFRAVTRDMMLRDAKMMKEANFNAVRCSHYTHHPLWYEICDRFGLAVVAEANIESHGLSYHKCVLPGDCPEWVSPVHDRLERMVRNTGNHPSVVMWSLGNEAGWGGAFESGASLVRGIDPMKRPIQYADMNAVADFDSQTYPTEKWLREWIAGTAVRKGERGEKTALRQHGPQPSGRPYVANEYAHAMGNSTGNFAEYWEVFDLEPRMAGGFVWEWVEHGISSRDALGRVRVAKFPDPRTWLYGGDFGDMPNGGNFCCDGLVRADRTANPGLAEVSYVQQPLSVNMVDGEIELTNRRYFTYLTPLRNRIGWRLLVDGRQMSTGELELPGKIAPRAKWMQRFEEVRRLCENVKGEKVLRVSLLENGAVIAECEALIASEMPESLPKAGGHPVFKVEWQAVFDRVPPDNDRGCRFVCTTNIAAVIESAADGTVRTLRFDVRGEHARRGIRCLLPASAVKRVAWYGRGPWENTPDRCHGALLGIWNVEDPVTLATPYSRPQENGQRCDVRWLELESENGSVVRIGGEKPFVFCLRPYTSRELASAAHFTDLPPFSGQPECWELTLDSAHRGVGGDNSWNAQPMEKYRLKPASGSFKWVFQDCGVSASAGKLRAETAAISGVSVLPSATHTHPQK